jgi:hypothetical protein
MSYFKEIDNWLDGLLAPLAEQEREGAKREIKERILQSYRNGMAAGPEDDEAERVPSQSGGRRPTDITSLHAALDGLGHAFEELENSLRAQAAARPQADKASGHRPARRHRR